MKYSVILPTYNERNNLPLIYFLIDKYLSLDNIDFEVVIVDDSSPDNTIELATAIQNSYGKKRVKIVSRKGKLGLASAYLSGLTASSGDRIIVMDADLSHHPKFILQMIKSMDTNCFDIVCGTRYNKQCGGVSGWNYKRKIISQGANILATVLLNPGVSDVTGSFRLYKRVVIEKILPKVLSKGYSFQMEILVHSKKEGIHLGELPITFVDRVYGESKLGSNEIIAFLKCVLRLFFTT